MDSSSDQPGAGHALPNGIKENAKVEDTHVDGKDASVVNGESPDAAMSLAKTQPDRMRELPPEIQHITEGYVPLSLLFERAAQDTFRTLDRMLSDAADTEHGEQPRMNGDTGQTKQQKDASDTTRLGWMNFAHNGRERFMKLFVMLQWARSSREPIGRLVDVNSWMNQGRFVEQEVQEALGLIRKDFLTTSILAPDIETALRLLSGDSVPTAPNHGYLPKKPLTAGYIAKELDRLNTLLHIRLNLHQDLPKPLQNFAIASGRVTFTVPNMFEMDLSILDEDPTSRFFFIELRYLFSPSSEIPKGQLRHEVEFRLNSILASEGLIPCLDFLQDYILTYKLSVLRRQAMELARSSWSGHLRVERIHRSLILQYWTERPAKKSWIEIGVSSGKVDDANDDEKGQPRLYAKWSRYGKAIPEQDVPFLNSQDLDLESYLNDIVGRHIEGLMRTTARTLKARLASPAAASLRVSRFASDRQSCCITIPLYSRFSAEIQIEPVTGRFAIRPQNVTNRRTAEILNDMKDPLGNTALRILDWRHQDASFGVQDGAVRRGWELARSKNLEIALRRKAFEDAQARPTFLRRWRTPQWVVAACPDGALGVNFWLFEMKTSKPEVREIDGFQVKNFRRIDVEGSVFSDTFFSNLEEVVASVITSSTMHRRLDELHLSHRSKFANTGTNAQHIFIKMPTSDFDQSMSRKVTLSYSTQIPSSDEIPKEIEVEYMATIAIESGSELLALQKCIAKSPDVKIRSDGVAQISQVAALGSHDTLEHIIDKALQLSRVSSCLRAIHADALLVDVLSMEVLKFTYADKPEILAAALDMSKPKEPSLNFDPRSNPHRRLRQILETRLRKAECSVASLSALPATLLESLPVLQAFDIIEQQKQGPVIHVADSETYHLRYTRPWCSIKLQSRRHGQSTWWHMSHEQRRKPSTQRNIHPNGEPVNERLKDALHEIYSQPSSVELKALHTAVLVSVVEVRQLLVKIDEIVRSCSEGDLEPPSPPKLQQGKAKPAPLTLGAMSNQVQGAPQPPNQQPQQPPNPQQQQRLNLNGNSNGPIQAQPMAQSRSHQGITNQPPHLRPQSTPMTQSRSAQGQGRPTQQTQNLGPIPRSSNNTPIPRGATPNPPNVRNGQLPTQQNPSHQAQGQQGLGQAQAQGNMGNRYGQGPAQGQLRGGAPNQYQGIDYQSLMQQGYAQGQHPNQFQGQGQGQSPAQGVKRPGEPNQDGRRKIQKGNGNENPGQQGQGQWNAQGQQQQLQGQQQRTIQMQQAYQQQQQPQSQQQQPVYPNHRGQVPRNAGGQNGQVQQRQGGQGGQGGQGQNGKGGGAGNKDVVVID